MGFAVRPMVLSLLLAAGSAPGMAEVRCPPLLEGHAYARASVFDGPPEEQADLVPDDQRGGVDRWEVGFIFRTRRAPYLVCRYRGTERTVTFRLQRPVGVCLAPVPPRTAFCR
ncbi:STY0301 family protein [Rhodopila globiformis]|uniref:Uncharacterized protein n=1 Tax=Rhodopila globiformis TaxID=1071 RepID=A0A2S6NII6_RHOGL|nr:STY0301 family protein [Rhodopila globiformis]PPQ34471.1 hypothetical protein CCS01_10745 [Rhodopila globiformis]